MKPRHLPVKPIASYALTPRNLCVNIVLYPLDPEPARWSNTCNYVEF